MPPRLPAGRGLCAPSPSSLLIRAFSSTPSAAAPPREHLHPQHHTPSSSTTASSSASSTTSSLLSIDSNDRHRRNAAPGANPSSQRGDAASRLLSRYKNRAEAAIKTKQAQLELLRNQKNSNDFLKQMPRRWDAGDVYSPHDLSPVEMQKWRKRSLRSNDVVDALGIRPLDMYKVGR